MNRFVRFRFEGQARYGRVHGDEVFELDGAPWEGGKASGRLLPLRGLPLLAPVTPSKIVCIGRNYAAHAKELGNEVPEEPLIFLKPPSSVVGPSAHIVLPKESDDVQHEAELALVIGRRCRNVSPEAAAEVVAGFTCLNDVTARDIQRKEKHLTRSKSFDTFCPIGPWVVEGFPDAKLRVRCRVGEELRQDGTTEDFVFSPAALVSFVSRIMTLEPGDVISTGTPAGVSKMVAGDTVEVEIEGVGVLRNSLVAEE